jgi:hypothetical protein
MKYSSCDTNPLKRFYKSPGIPYVAELFLYIFFCFLFLGFGFLVFSVCWPLDIFERCLDSNPDQIAAVACRRATNLAAITITNFVRNCPQRYR